MSDLINRAYAIEAVKELNAKVNDDRYETICTLDVLRRINALPSAEATIGDYPNDLIRRSALMEYCSNQKSKTIDNNDIARFPSAEAVQGDGKMIPIELKKRYPHSRDEDITDAFMRGYKSAQSVQGWIPCSERLPDVDVEVLATVDWSDVRIAWLMKGGAWETDEYILESDEILAWMPLPKPYKGGDDE